MVVLMRFFTVVVLMILCLATSGQDLERLQPDRVILIGAERFAFTPSKITVAQGEVVEFVLTSDDTDHGFRIPGTGVDVAIPPQGSGEVRVRFRGNEKGEYVFECSRPCGAGHNIMRGFIEVN
jgi:cytochrome c oxidase subunit 2